jgi:hypothetical protein
MAARRRPSPELEKVRVSGERGPYARHRHESHLPIAELALVDFTLEELHDVSMARIDLKNAPQSRLHASS